MKVQVRNLDGVSVVDCSGEVDLHSSTQLRSALLKEIRSGGPSVLVNMIAVRYIDSSGIATLVEALQRAGQAKTRFGLFGLQKNARNVLQLARLHTVFNIFETEQEAVEKIPSTEPWKGL